MSLLAHFRTLWPTLRHMILPYTAGGGSQAWEGAVVDPERGPLSLHGRYRPSPRTKTLLLIAHGLGGTAESHYGRLADHCAEKMGWSALRLNFRGAGDAPSDLYHAGISDDLHGALNSPRFDAYERIFVLGFSMGGNVVLKFATEALDSRVAAVAAACAPIDLGACADWIDAQPAVPYRKWIIDALKDQYALIARRTEVPTHPDSLKQVTRFREWDAMTVCPRFGFADPQSYYSAMSAGPRLQDLKVPALLVQSRHDPVVAAASVAPWLKKAPAGLDQRWVSGAGHLGFPRRLDLGEPAPHGFENQVLAWLDATQASPISNTSSRKRPESKLPTS